MKDIVSINKARALMLGRFAGLSVLAAVAMIFVTPLISLANPAMCGRAPQPGNWVEAQVIQGFTLKRDDITIDKFIPATSQDIRLGSWVEVKHVDTDGKTLQDVPVVVVKATLKGSKYDIISFNDALKSTEAWQVNFSVDKAKVKDCTLNPQNNACTIARLAATDPTVPLASPIPVVDTNLNPAPKTAPIMLGSFVEVTLPDGTKAAVAMIGSVIQHIDPKLGGYARGYIPPSDNTPKGELVKITLTQDMITQIKDGIKASRGSLTGW